MRKNTVQPKIERPIHEIDAAGMPLGRLATQIATLLRGKHKADFVLHHDVGDYVVVTNAQKVKLTGKKLEQKTYYWHTGYLGHIKEKKAKDVLQTRPGEIIERAVFGMLPRNRLRALWMRRLTVHAGEK